MSGIDQIVKGDSWCLRSETLPGGTLAQVLAWLEADLRPNLVVRIYRPPTPEEPDVWFLMPGSGEILRLPVFDFTRRYQPVRGQELRAEQVSPERPPASQQELIERRLAGW